MRKLRKLPRYKLAELRKQRRIIHDRYLSNIREIRAKFLAKKRHRPLVFREEWEASLRQDENNPKNRKMLNFIKEREETPDYICCCCEGLFFVESVRPVTIANMEEWAQLSVLNYNSEWICNTCRKHANSGRTPTLSTANGLQFPDLPEVLRELSALEERLVASIVNFMQIKPLMPHSLNPQLSLKGSVVNIPVKVNEMITSLPRKPNQMQTIQLKFKRHIERKSDYMFETIDQNKVSEALKFLCQQE